MIDDPVSWFSLRPSQCIYLPRQRTEECTAPSDSSSLDAGAFENHPPAPSIQRTPSVTTLSQRYANVCPLNSFSLTAITLLICLYCLRSNRCLISLHICDHVRRRTAYSSDAYEIGSNSVQFGLRFSLPQLECTYNTTFPVERFSHRSSPLRITSWRDPLCSSKLHVSEYIVTIRVPCLLDLM